MNYQPQTYNNCSRCSVAILLGYYDHWITQFQVDDDLAPGYFPCQVARYMPRYRLMARVYAPAAVDPVRRLLANGIPVIVLQLLSLEEPIGHYRVLRGYNDQAGEFISDDPLQKKGPDYRISYEVFDQLTRGRGLIIPIYPPEQDLVVASLMRGVGVRETSCGPSHYAIRLGDLDMDGDQDAFIANWTWLNDGSGAFALSGGGVGYLGTFFDLALGDLDGDGDTDAFVTSMEAANTVWLNDGTGRLEDSGQELGDQDSLWAALGDLDGDGDLDAFVSNSYVNEVWLNDGSGTFVNSGLRLLERFSKGVELGDVDGDDDLDAFVLGFNTVHVWLNDGDEFTKGGWSLELVARDVALGDLDGDGDLDAFIAGSRDGDAVWLNDGGGTFVDSGQGLGSSKDVALGDMDGDGDLDAVSIATLYPGKIRLNDGTGVFNDSGQTLETIGSTSAGLGDLDGDDDLDVIAVNSSTTFIVWLNEMAQAVEQSRASGLGNATRDH
jgi:hypothetical protein